MEDWKIQIHDVGYKTSKELYIFRNIGGGKSEFMTEGNIVTVGHGEAYPKPTLELTTDMLQNLANELDKRGFKPQQGYLEGKLEATEKHLEDMRGLVLKKK